MTTNAIEIQGTLREDGTLVLDRSPELPPGRVTVTVRAIPDYKQTEMGPFFERIWAERKALGIAPRSKEEIDAYLATMRDDDEPAPRTAQTSGSQQEQESRKPPEAT